MNAVENIIEETNVNVEEGEKFLSKAARYKVAAYPLVGALLGTCIGGPVGLIAGVKVGGLAALGCGILGKVLYNRVSYLERIYSVLNAYRIYRGIFPKKKRSGNAEIKKYHGANFIEI